MFTEIFWAIKNKSRKLLNNVEDSVLNWNWNDNVSQIYKEIFTSDVIIEVKKSHEDLIKDLHFRINHKIAPGYKGSGKIDDGIGDLIIWQTALEIAKDKNKDLIIVSNEQKNDWFYKQDKEGLYPKYELFDEFRRFTGGNSMHIINFPKFLELQHARQETIDQVKKTIKKTENSEYSIGYELSDLREGLRIEHKNYGVGTITKLYKIGDRDACIINFESGVRTKFIISHTPMKILNTKLNRELLNQTPGDELLEIDEALEKIYSEE